jgi:glutamate racemase
MNKIGPIGVFDSGYGGLTILKDVVNQLPYYDYIYLGDNARTPYGTRSYKTVYEFTLQSVNWLFSQGTPLIILACNTASAKALRTIQQKDLPQYRDGRRVLGVIRPTTEIVGKFSKTNHVGILATKGTVESDSYPIEIKKFFPQVKVFQQACPLWVPLIENNEFNSPGAAYFIKKYVEELLKQSSDIDTILLACTHYPLLEKQIKKYLPENITLISQGKIVADSLNHYLNRHVEIGEKCSRGGEISFFTTDATGDFDQHSTIFFGKKVHSVHIDLEEL